MQNKQKDKAYDQAEANLKQGSAKKEMNQKQSDLNKRTSQGEGSNGTGNKMNQDHQQSKKNKK